MAGSSSRDDADTLAQTEREFMNGIFGMRDSEILDVGNGDQDARHPYYAPNETWLDRRREDEGDTHATLRRDSASHRERAVAFRASGTTFCHEGSSLKAGKGLSFPELAPGLYRGA